MKFLKQSTSAVIIFGPALSPSDGVTLVTSLVSALDHVSTGIFIYKNGGAGAVRHATVTATTYDSYGNYLVTLDTTDTNTLGRLRVMFAAAASCLPIWEDFTVLPANVFDSIVGGSANLKVDVDTVKTQAVTCAAGVTVLASVGTAATSTAQTGDCYSRIGAPAGASVSADVAAVKVDTAAVKVQTDKLTFTVANQVDSNVLDWKSATAPAMTGDAFARIGAAGAGLTALGDARVANLDAAVSTRLASASYTAPDNADILLIKAKTDNLPAAPAAVGDIPTANQNADALLDRAAGIETSWTVRQGLRVMLASMAAKLSGAATSTVSIRDVGDTKDRIVATVDANGNRSAITYDKT
jgi:hypothetical protein